MGNTVNLEKLSYVAFQKRFGKSVGRRAPGMFVELLRRRAESAGGLVHEYNTRTTRHSQLCHNCGTLEKKPLSQRVHDCACGVRAQRDLYSAFLAFCMDGDTFNADRAQKTWSQLDKLLQTAWKDTELANGKRKPSSFGLDKRSQSQSSAVSSKKDIRKALAAVPMSGPEKADAPSRTPRLPQRGANRGVGVFTKRLVNLCLRSGLAGNAQR